MDFLIFRTQFAVATFFANIEFMQDTIVTELREINVYIFPTFLNNFEKQKSIFNIPTILSLSPIQLTITKKM